MDKRACIYIRLGWMFLFVIALSVVSRYVSQLRFATIGFCPPAVTGASSLLVFDSLRLETLCVPLPQADKSLLAPVPPADDKKTGV